MKRKEFKENLFAALDNDVDGISYDEKMILVHNHPSGDTTPSVQDIETTNKINEICKILDFQLLDHIIISDGSYTSLKEEGVF